MLWPKKIHTRNLITKKNSCGSKIPLPPHNFSNGPSLNKAFCKTTCSACLSPEHLLLVTWSLKSYLPKSCLENFCGDAFRFLLNSSWTTTPGSLYFLRQWKHDKDHLIAKIEKSVNNVIDCMWYKAMQLRPNDPTSTFKNAKNVFVFVSL